MIRSVVAICIGASLGACLRWSLGLALDRLFPFLSVGILCANLVGGYCIGLAVSVFAVMPELAPEWRFFVVTGFLGALTTFSSFSAEIFLLLQQQRFGMAFIGMALHVFGSLFMTGCGIGTFWLIRNLLR